MGKALIILAFKSDRAKAKHWIDIAPPNTRVTFQSPTRSLPQNAILHAALTRLAERQSWHGQRLSVTDWKRLLTASMDRELRLVPNVQGDGFVALGRSTAEMSKADLSALLEYVISTAAQFGWDIEEREE